jgi:antitoxin (DNA-binding transcriptional repressor) of toxin-antitoxin stability system
MTKGRFPAGKLQVKRAYEPPAPEDGVRILVDRLWPRGLSKQKAAVDRWMKGHRAERRLTQMVPSRPQDHLSRLIEAALAREEVVIAKGDEPVVRLVPIPQGQFRFGVRPPGALGEGPDFSAPMSTRSPRGRDALERAPGCHSAELLRIDIGHFWARFCVNFAGGRGTP